MKAEASSDRSSKHPIKVAEMDAGLALCLIMLNPLVLWGALVQVPLRTVDLIARRHFHTGPSTIHSLNGHDWFWYKNQLRMHQHVSQRFIFCLTYCQIISDVLFAAA